MNDIAMVFLDKTYARGSEETFYLRKIEKAHKGIAENREGSSEANFYQRSLRGKTIPAAAMHVGVVKTIAYVWLSRRNESCYEGLVPRFAGGKPSRLTGDQKKELKA